MQYVLLFRGDTCYTKASQCYVKRTLSVLSVYVVNLDTKETSQALGMHTVVLFLQSERQHVHQLHLIISGPVVHPDGLEEHSPEYKSVALPTESAYSVIRVYSVCRYIYIYICEYTYKYVHIQIYAHNNQSVKFPIFWISAPSRRLREVPVVALPSSEFP